MFKRIRKNITFADIASAVAATVVTALIYDHRIHKLQNSHNKEISKTWDSAWESAWDAGVTAASCNCPDTTHMLFCYGHPSMRVLYNKD